MSETRKPHVSDEKKQLVARIVSLIDQYPVVGVVDVENLPALQLNRMRSQLRGSVVVFMCKKRLMSIALKKAKDKEGLEKLCDHLTGMPAFIFTSESPFKLFKTLKKSKSKAPIKGGQRAPNTIIVPAGPTSFAPGPIIGELGSLGIKSGIEGGKIAVKEDAVVAKEGDIVSEKLAGVLTRLGIEPMEIGLNLCALWENGSILRKDVLDVDEDAYMNMIGQAHLSSFNLALYISYATSETIGALIQKAHREAFGLAFEQGVLTDQTKELVLAKAHAQASALQALIPATSDSKDIKTAPQGEIKEE
jgi:large subunit ribosomal protein L10